MDCFSFVSVIIIVIMIINMYCKNDEYLNISLIVILILCFVIKFFRCNCKKQQQENLENSETKTTQTDKYKYYTPDIEFIESLFNKEKIIIDNLNVGKITCSYIKELLYPVGSVVISDKKVGDLKLPGTWKKIEGGRLIATSGEITVIRTTNSSTENKEFRSEAKYAENNYPVYKYTVDKSELKMGHNQTSKEAHPNKIETGEEVVKLYGNNIMNHSHPIWPDWRAMAYDSASHGKNEDAFALVGGGGSDARKCQDAGQEGSCRNELYPSRKTWIYVNNQKKEVTDTSYKAHNNVPKYILVYAYIRTA